MKKVSWVLIAALAVGIAMPVLAGEKGEKCSYDAQACLNGLSAKKDKGWAGIDADKNEAGGVFVKGLIKSGPAEKAGFMVGDVLVARNGIKMADHEAMKADKDSWKIGANVIYTVLRNEKEKQLTVTLVQMPEDVFAKLVGAHMISDHMGVATAVKTEAEKPAATAAASEKATEAEKAPVAKPATKD